MINREPPAPLPVDSMEVALGEYFDRVDRGAPVDVAALLAAYPECATQLREFLSNEGYLHKAMAAASPPPTELAGRTLGDFCLLRELGRGGMGVVYEAEQLSLGRRVALKVLPFAAMLDKQQLARFKNEARAAATLDHPHIVAVHSVGSEGDVHYYAMQLIAGQSLAQVIASLRHARRPALPAAEASLAARSTDGQQLATDFHRPELTPAAEASQILGPQSNLSAAPCDTLQSSPLPAFDSRGYYRTAARLGIEAATALDHAHQNGIVHRDIKPANLLVDDHGKLWVADFGLARIEADAGLTMTGDMLGTLRYMSPEQALAQRVVVDHRSDVYSLGATLYELLTLEPAFGETNRSQLLQQIARDEPRAPRRLNNLIPHDLETIVLKAMRKSPQERYATAQALADDLTNFLDDTPIEARPPTRRERLVKWSRRHPVAVWSTVLVLFATTIAAVASGVVIAQAYRRESVQRDLAETERQRAEDQKLRAELERERAETNFERAREAVRDILVDAARGEGPWSQLSSEMRTLFANRAVTYYESLLQEESDDPSLQFETAVGYCSLATMHNARQEFKQAEQLQRKSLKILDRLSLEHPDAVHYRQQRAWTNFTFGATLVSQERFSEAELAIVTAISVYKQLIEEKPEETAYFPELQRCFEKLELVRQSLDNNTWEWTDEGLAIYQGAVRRVPENPNAHQYVGIALQEKGSLDEAIISLRVAVRLEPDNADFRNSFAILLLQNGLVNDAIPHLREAVRLEPNIAALQHSLGYALAQAGQTGEAIAILRTAISLEPINWRVHYLLGLTLSLQGGATEEAGREYQQAIEGFRQRIEILPYDDKSMLWLARALTTCPDLKQRQPAEAVTWASKAVELKPRDGANWNVLGRAHYRQANYRDAIKALLRARELGDHAASTFFFLAMAEWQLGNADAAREWYGKGIQWLEQRPQIVGGEIVLIRAEAEQLLGVPAPARPEAAVVVE